MNRNTNSRALVARRKTVLTSLIVLLAWIGVNGSAAADYELRVDCYHDDLSLRGSDNPIKVEAYKDGKLLGHDDDYIGDKNTRDAQGSTGCGPVDDDPIFWVEAPGGADEYRLYATGEDAAVIDVLEGWTGILTDWGNEDGYAWCLSTDPTDYWSDTDKLNFGQCMPCISFRKDGSWGWCPDTESYQLLRTNPGFLSTTAVSADIALGSNSLLRMAEDIAAVDHDGDGVDEVAALLNDDGVQHLVVYEADLSGNPVGSWSTPLSDVLAIAGVDLDGNGIDEIALLLAVDDTRVLRVYNAPIGAQPRGAAVNGIDVHRRIVDIAGVDVEGNGFDEIALLRDRVKDDADNQNLYVIRIVMPFSLAITVGTSTQDLPDGGSFSIAGIDYDGDGADEIGVLKTHEDNWSSNTLFELYEAPVGTQNSTAIALDHLIIPGSILNKQAIAIAGVDHDGDGKEEVAVIRH